MADTQNNNNNNINNNNYNNNNNNNNNNNTNEEIQWFMDLWSEAYKPLAWASMVYFLIWYPPWTLFCFIWVLSTSLISIILLVVFLPFGYFACIGTVMSWRYKY